MTPELRKTIHYQKLLGERKYRARFEVDGILACSSDYKQGNTPPDETLFSAFENGGEWGQGRDTHTWFRLTLKNVPEDAFLIVSTDKTGWDADNPQFLAYVNGSVRQGLDVNHTELRLDEGTNDVWLYGYIGPKEEHAKLFLTLAIRERTVSELWYDVQYPLSMLDYLDPESGEYAEILKYLHRAVSLLDFSTEESLRETAARAHEFLTEEFYGTYCARQKATTVCIGHTHIDCAWKWTLRQTREKVQRSFATVLELMKRYPEYQFMSSQPLLYEYLKEEAPDLYREVREKIRENRWEAEGAMWVEADCNLPAGESLVRQVLYGKRFFREEFGIDSRILWLPDVFGYSAALPQILKKSGVDWFVTSKISWNDLDRMPYDTFRWKGIDGTAINTYFLTAQNDKGPSSTKTTYVGHLTAPMVSGTYKRYQQKYLSNEVLLTFGYGDGGGGPTEDDLELGRRGKHGVPGSPNALIGTAGEFLKRLEKRIEGDPRLPVWQGELYLEYHRGTYTTQARNKLHNRKGEFLLQNAELGSVISRSLFGTPVPKAALDGAWKTLLTNQFHDIIPGSSIREVYEQSEKDYAEVFSVGGSIVQDLTKRLASSADPRDGYVIFNPTGFRTRGTVVIDGKTVRTGPVPPMGYALISELQDKNRVSIRDRKVETDRFSVTFDDHWQIVSLYDRENGREVLKPNSIGNELRLYDDYPDKYDAWEFQAYSRETYRTVTDVSSEEVIDDGIRKGIRIGRVFGASRLVQTVWFYEDGETIEFETAVQWHERHKMLKAAFPVDVLSDKATFEIQFGTIERPTHFNTSWDQARFESCVQKFADLSDGGYGVSVLNDCKYGYDVHDGVIQLSLLRSPTNPDPEADQGEQRFTYAVAPHRGTLHESNTVRLAYELNQPMIAVKPSGDRTTVPFEWSAAECDQPNVVLETVKPSEDGSGTVLRFYETANRRCQANVRLGLPATRVELCDLLERVIEPVPYKDGSFSLSFGNYEIVTVKIS